MISLSFKFPGLLILSELPTQFVRYLPSCLLGRWKLPSAFLATHNPKLQTSRIFLNAKAQTPDIPDFSIRAALAKYSVSLQSQAKEPVIPSMSLRASKRELSTNLNVQTQAPDDPCPLHPHGAPREFVLKSSVFKRVLPRFYTNRHSHPSFHYVSHDHSYLLTCRTFK